MFNFLLGNCNCYSSNGSDISADIELFALDIVEALSNERIKISLDVKFSLNCTTVSKGDAIYLSKFIPDIRKDSKLRGVDLVEQNMLFMEEDAESSYSGLVQSTFELSPGMYCVYYVRPQMKYDTRNSNWKILGFSKAFKLDLLEEDSSVMKQSVISVENLKQNNSILEFFNRNILGFSDSPPKNELQIAKLSQIQIEEEIETECEKKEFRETCRTETNDKSIICKDFKEIEEAFQSLGVNRQRPPGTKLIFEKPLEKKDGKKHQPPSQSQSQIMNTTQNNQNVRQDCVTNSSGNAVINLNNTNILNNNNVLNSNNPKEESAKKKVEKSNEVSEAQKFYTESLMKIKKSKQDFMLSPKNRFPGGYKMKRKGESNHKENMK